MSISDLFENKLGVKLKNTRWSWGASNPDTKQVFLRVWDDDFQSIDGLEHIRILGKDWVGPSHGFPERIRHIEELRKGSEGYGVLCTAEDSDPSDARRIKTFDHNTLLQFGQIIDVGKNVFARVVAYIPVENIYSPILYDLKAIWETGDVTTREARANARVGQGQFREDVLKIWGSRCCVTGSTTTEAIRASHIKSWQDSDDPERLDPFNGLPLIATLDALFDRGLITFSPDGKLVVSNQLSASERKLLDLDGRQLRRRPDIRTEKYLACHRKSIFLDEQD